MDKTNTLLLVDDEERVLSSLQRLLKKEGYEIFTAASGKAALDVLRAQKIGVILSDMMMPEMDGLTFLERASQLDPDCVQILLTGQASLEAAMAAINRLRIYGFLIKPWEEQVLKNTLDRAFEYYNLAAENKQLQQLTQTQNEQLQAFNESLEEQVRNRTQLLDEAIRESVLMLARAAEVKDGDAEGHIYRVLDGVLDLCQALEIPEPKADMIALFAMVHDLGKIRVPDSILEKKGELTAGEQTIKKNHTILGEEMLGVKPFYHIARQITRSHHENWDGSGYPDGLAGDKIPLAARIVAVADIYDTFRHQEPYKSAWDAERCLAEISSLAGTVLDPEIVGVFVPLQERKMQSHRP